MVDLKQRFNEWNEKRKERNEIWNKIAMREQRYAALCFGLGTAAFLAFLGVGAIIGHDLSSVGLPLFLLGLGIYMGFITAAGWKVDEALKIKHGGVQDGRL